MWVRTVLYPLCLFTQLRVEVWEAWGGWRTRSWKSSRTNKAVKKERDKKRGSTTNNIHQYTWGSESSFSMTLLLDTPKWRRWQSGQFRCCTTFSLSFVVVLSALYWYRVVEVVQHLMTLHSTTYTCTAKYICIYTAWYTCIGRCPVSGPLRYQQKKKNEAWWDEYRRWF